MDLVLDDYYDTDWFDDRADAGRALAAKLRDRPDLADAARSSLAARRERTASDD